MPSLPPSFKNPSSLPPLLPPCLVRGNAEIEDDEVLSSRRWGAVQTWREGWEEGGEEGGREGRGEMVCERVELSFARDTRAHLSTSFMRISLMEPRAGKHITIFPFSFSLSLPPALLPTY